MERTVGLIAGEGRLPEEIFIELVKKDSRVRVYSLRRNNSSFSSLREDLYVIDKIDIEKIITDMRAAGITEIVMAGHVPKSLMYSPERLSSSMVQLFGSLDDLNDHTLLAGIVSVFEKMGIKVMRYMDLIPELLVKEGPLTEKVPDEEQSVDIEYGKKILSAILPLSFGQSIVVNSCSVVAVEAMEGTDQMIRRAGGISSGGVVIKMMRPDQDERFDIPTVGIDTLENMAVAGIKCLALEAGRTIILDMESFLKLAGDKGIAVTGVRPCRSS